MSYEKVKQYFESCGLSERITIHDQITDTVEHASEQIGCKAEQIVKTMSFITREGPVLVAMAGDAKISNQKYKAAFHEKAKMVSGSEVENLIGHIPGGVCPFAVKEEVKVYLDVSLKRFQEVFAAAGDPKVTIRLSLEELTEHAHMEAWVDVCKD